MQRSARTISWFSPLFTATSSPASSCLIRSLSLSLSKSDLPSSSLGNNVPDFSFAATPGPDQKHFPAFPLHPSGLVRMILLPTQQLHDGVRFPSSLRCSSYFFVRPHSDYGTSLPSSLLWDPFYPPSLRTKGLSHVRSPSACAVPPSSSSSPIFPSLHSLSYLSPAWAPTAFSCLSSLSDLAFPSSASLILSSGFSAVSSSCVASLSNPAAVAVANRCFRGSAAVAVQQRRRRRGVTEVAVVPEQQVQPRSLSAAATAAATTLTEVTTAAPPVAPPATAAGVKRGDDERVITDHHQRHRGISTAAGGGEGGWTGLPQRGLLNSWYTIATVEKVSATPIRPMTIKRLLQLEPANEASLLKGAEWIREELPVRLSHRLYDFHRLPLVAVAHPLIFSVYESYLTTFDRTRKLPPITSASDLTAFIKIVEKERSTHDRTVDYMGQGVRQLRRVCKDVDLNAFLERFFYFRIGRRVMIDQLVHLQHEQKGWRGIIHLECHAAKVIEQRARDVREACRSTYGIAPRVLLTGNTEMRFATIPDHLALIITEILKNALRATVEFHTMGNSLVDASTRSLIQDDDDLPEVKIEVYKGKREVVIKISDKGGGVPPAKLSEMWSFGYSTVTESNTKIQENSSLGPSFIRSDMAGYGFGLPLARAFARYFGGDIHVQSHFGIGTDVYITLNHIGDQEEALYFEERPDLRMGQKLSSETS